MATTYDASRQASRSRRSWTNPFRDRSGALDQARRAAIHTSLITAEDAWLRKKYRLKTKVILLVDARIDKSAFR
jgi:hypothetical protein